MSRLILIVLVTVPIAAAGLVGFGVLNLPGFEAWRPSGKVVNLLASVVAGFLGGLLALRHRGQSDVRLDDLDRRIRKLERHQLAAVNERPAPSTREPVATSRMPPPRRPDEFASPADLERDVPSKQELNQSYEPRGLDGQPYANPAADEPSQLSQERLKEFAGRFGRVASGDMTRSKFAAFFAEIGKAGPVEAINGGEAIEGNPKNESFLTGVFVGEGVLVFPSYDFVANQETQFNTVASVPEGIAAAFELMKGDGNIILEKPAVYREGVDGLELVSKGELRGFSG